MVHNVNLHKQQCETRKLLIPGSRYGVLRRGAQFAIVLVHVPSTGQRLPKRAAEAEGILQSPQFARVPLGVLWGMTMDGFVPMKHIVYYLGSSSTWE